MTRDQQDDKPDTAKRLCVMCRHFYKESGYTYSTLTQGDGFMACSEGIIWISDGDDTDEFRQKIKTAATCVKYDETEG